jgi:uncharacterized protein YjlB
VVEFNGPGNNGSEVRDGVAYELKAGDVVVIPAGTGHWLTRIDDDSRRPGQGDTAEGRS